MQLYGIITKVRERKPAANQRLFSGKSKVRDPAFIATILPRLQVTPM
jgi:hypothetical protein